MQATWVPLGQALADVPPAVGASAWDQVRQWIGDGELPARGEIGGVLRELKPAWIPFLMAFLDQNRTPPLPPPPDPPPEISPETGMPPELRAPPAVYSDEPDGDCLMFDLRKAADYGEKIAPAKMVKDGFCWMTKAEVERAALDRLLRAAGVTLDAGLLPDTVEPGDGQLTHAGAAAIRRAMREVYQTNDRPNVNDVVPLVQAVLKVAGSRASKPRIQRIASEKEFAAKRRGQGEHRLRPPR